MRYWKPWRQFVIALSWALDWWPWAKYGLLDYLYPPEAQIVFRDDGATTPETHE